MAVPEGVAIRAAEPDDAGPLAHLQLDCWDDAYTGLVPQDVLDGSRVRAGERVATWRRMLTDGARVLVAETDDGFVGFASHGRPRDDDPTLDPAIGLELYAIYVRAAWWGTGLGRALLDATVGDRPAYLWVVEGNARATRFYERQGFRLDGCTKDEPEGRHLRMVRR